MKLSWLLALLAGCSFQPPADATDAPRADGPDGPPVGDGGGGQDVLRDTPDPPPPDGLPFVCPAGYDIDPPGGTVVRYRAVTTTATWLAAQMDCADDADPNMTTAFTHLVVFEDDTERSSADVNELPGNAWIGLSDLADEGVFRWVTNVANPPSGSPWWAGANPDGGETDNCARVNNGGDFDDKPCGTAMPYICECDALRADPSRWDE